MSPRQARISGITATESGLTFGQRLGEDSWFKAHAMAVSTMRPALRRPPNERLARCGEGKMLGKVRSMSIAAATLLASPAFAGEWLIRFFRQLRGHAWLAPSNRRRISRSNESRVFAPVAVPRSVFR